MNMNMKVSQMPNAPTTSGGYFLFVQGGVSYKLSTTSLSSSFGLYSSPNWNSTYTTVYANSATWGGSSDDTQASTKVRASSANWDSNYTTVLSNSATWGYQGLDLKALSGNWQSSYTTVFANSASWSGFTGVLPISSGGTRSSTISGTRINFKVPASDNTGVSGGIEVTNVLVISQSAYDILTPNPTTLYYII